MYMPRKMQISQKDVLIKTSFRFSANTILFKFGLLKYFVMRFLYESRITKTFITPLTVFIILPPRVFMRGRYKNFLRFFSDNASIVSSLRVCHFSLRGKLK